MKLSSAVLAGLVAVSLPAAAETVKIGEILTLSGPGASPGLQIDRGLKLYLKEHAKELPAGVTVELVPRDDTGPNPDLARRLAQELVTGEHIQLLVGAVYTPNAEAIAPIVTEAKIPFIVANAAALSIPRLSPYIVRVSYTLWQTAYPLGEWVAKRGGKKGYTVAPDYEPGHDAQDGFAAGFHEHGGTIIGTTGFPLGTLDYTPYLQRMIRAKPDTAYIFVPVGDAVTMMRAVAALNLPAAGIMLVSTMNLVPDEQLLDMGNSALGLVTSGTYSAIGKRPQNRAFVAAWKRAYGPQALPDFTGVEGWDAMAAVFAVLKGTGGKVDPDRAMAILAHWKNPDSPRGPIEIDPATRDIIENVYMRKVELVNGKLANVEFQTMRHTMGTGQAGNPPR